MMRSMAGTQKKDINAEIEFIEKLHRLGDDTSVQHLSRGLLLSETLSPEEKKRIRKVLNRGTRGGTVVTTIIILILIVIFFLYIKYGA